MNVYHIQSQLSHALRHASRLQEQLHSERTTTIGKIVIGLRYGYTRMRINQLTNLLHRPY